MNIKLELQDIYELLMLDNTDWIISEHSINRLKIASDIDIPKIQIVKDIPKPQDNIANQAQQLIENTHSINELNDIIANNPQFNILTNSSINNFFSSNSNNLELSDLLIITSQKTDIDLWLEQAELNNYAIVNCSFIQINTLLPELRKKQENIYLPFLQKFIELNKPKVILTIGTAASQLLTQQTFPNSNNCTIYNEYTTLYTIYNIDDKAKSWFTILNIKNHFKKAIT